MVLRKVCRDLLVDKDLHCKDILKEKDAQCGNQSRAYTEFILKEHQASSNRLLEQKEQQLEFITRSGENIIGQHELHIQQMKNYTNNLGIEKDFHLKNMQKAMDHQQIFFGIFAAIAFLIVLVLVIVICYLFVRQEKEKRSMNQRYEIIIKEKSDRIMQLEKLREEKEAQSKKEMRSANSKTQMQSYQMPAHPIPSHTFMYAVPRVSPSFEPAMDQQSFVSAMDEI